MSAMDTMACLSPSYRYLPTVFRSLSNRSTPPHPRENSSLLSPIHPPSSADPASSASPLSPFCPHPSHFSGPKGSSGQHLCKGLPSQGESFAQLDFNTACERPPAALRATVPLNKGDK